MSRPLLALAAAFGAGCLVGGDAAGAGALTLAGLAGTLLALALVAPQWRTSFAAVLAAAVGVGAAGASAERLAYERAPLRALAETRPVEAGPVAIQGTARGDAQVFADRVLLAVDVLGVEEAGVARSLAGRVRIDVGGRNAPPPILDGDHLRLWASLRPIRGYRTPGAFDAGEAAFHDGVHAHGSCKSARLVEPGARGTGLSGVAARLRQHARGVFARYVPPGPEEGLVRAMVIGDRTGIDDATADSFRAAGTYHVLALSGAQVALVAAMLIGGLRRLGAGPGLQALVTVGAIAFYGQLVGGDVPIARAVVMAAVVLLGKALELDADAANLLGLAALFLLAWRPSNVSDVGFQLSFGATLGILLLTPPLVAGLPRWPLRVELLMAASVAAQAVLLPFMAGHFHRTAPAAILLNLVAVPLSSAVLVAGLALLLAAAGAPPLAPVLGDLAWGLAHALRRSSEAGGFAAALDWRGPGFSFLALAVWLVGLTAVRRGRRAVGLALLAAAPLVPWIEAEAPGDGRLHLTVLDVGQGDALVARSPGGQTWLVDAGGSARGRFDVGEGVVGPYLWFTGVRRLATVVVTHAHPDHVGGLPFLLRSFAVGAVWEGPAPRSDAAYRILRETLARASVEGRSVVRGVHVDWDGVKVEVLGPRPTRPPWRVRNDDSVVLALRMGDVRFLLTGDIEASAEAELLRSGGPEAFTAAVLKVPHHGSRGSSSAPFLAAVGPAIAVVSAGARNPFGHPHPEVLARYREAGALVLRTDTSGAVTVSTDGRRVWVRSVEDGAERRVR